MYTKLLLFILLLLIPFTINDENEDDFGKLYMEFLQEQYLEAIRNPIKYEPLSDEQVAQWLNEYDEWKNRQLLAQSGAPLTLYLKHNDHEPAIAIESTSDATFDDLKTAARQLFPDLKTFMIKFVLNGEEIKPNTDTDTLADLGINAESVINVQISTKLEDISQSFIGFEVKVHALLQKLTDYSNREFIDDLDLNFANAEYELLSRISAGLEKLEAFNGNNILYLEKSPNPEMLVKGFFYFRFEIDENGDVKTPEDLDLEISEESVTLAPNKFGATGLPMDSNYALVEIIQVRFQKSAN